MDVRAEQEGPTLPLGTSAVEYVLFVWGRNMDPSPHWTWEHLNNVEFYAGPPVGDLTVTAAEWGSLAPASTAAWG